MMLSIFSLSVGHLYVFGKISVHCPLPTFKIRLFGCFVLFVCVCVECISSLYSSDINPLMGITFTNTIFHSAGCPVISLMVSYAVQKIFILL